MTKKIRELIRLTIDILVTIGLAIYVAMNFTYINLVLLMIYFSVSNTDEILRAFKRKLL